MPNKGIPSNEKNNMTKLHIENQITEFPNKVSTQKITSNDIFDKLKDNILRSRRKYSSANDSNHLEPYENNILLDISNISEETKEYMNNIYIHSDTSITKAFADSIGSNSVFNFILANAKINVFSNILPVQH